MATSESAVRWWHIPGSALRAQVMRQPRVLSVYVLLGALAIGASIYSEAFRTLATLSNILTQSAFLAMASIGQFVVILTGGIDLSVGSVAKLSGLLTASIMNGSDANIPLAVAVAVGIGLIVGTTNALVITRLHVAPFVATFAMFYIVRGTALTFSTDPVGQTSPSFYALYTTRILGIPLPILFLASIWMGAWYALNRTRSGRYLYAVGGEENVARLAGIRIDRIKFAAYIGCALLASFAGLLNLTRIGIGDPNVGEGLELDTITAVVVGGASLFGGRGSIVGLLGGVLLLNTIIAVFDILQVSSLYQDLIKGLIIVGSVAVYRTRERT